MPLVYDEDDICYKTNLSPPITLSICSESRQFTQRCYTLFHFGWRPTSSFYIDYSLDTLWLQASFKEISRDYVPAIMKSEDVRHKVRNLAIGAWRWSWNGFTLSASQRSDWTKSLALMRALERLDVVFSMRQRVRNEYETKKDMASDKGLGKQLGEELRLVREKVWEGKAEWTCPEVRSMASLWSKGSEERVLRNMDELAWQVDAKSGKVEFLV